MPVTVQALPKNSNVCVHTCAQKTVLHTMRGDKAAAVWVAYVKPFVGLANGKEAAVQSEIATLCDEYADVFEQPGLPVCRDVDHRHCRVTHRQNREVRKFAHARIAILASSYSDDVR